MVLSYYPAPEAEPLLLDNLVAEILPASLRTDLRPVYSFNSEGLSVVGRDNWSLEDPAARGRIATLDGQVDHLVSQAASSLGPGLGRLHALVEDKARNQITQHSLPVR